MRLQMTMRIWPQTEEAVVEVQRSSQKALVVSLFGGLLPSIIRGRQPRQIVVPLGTRGMQPYSSSPRRAKTATVKDRKEPLTPHPIDPFYYAQFRHKSRLWKTAAGKKRFSA
jgi:hypothetical protein